jgi:hypothetical protein
MDWTVLGACLLGIGFLVLAGFLRRRSLERAHWPPGEGPRAAEPPAGRAAPRPRA